jgi:hypothetical protein
VRPSMGSVGDAYDNAMCESFFATLECELLDRRRFASQAEARMACFSFIEGGYNPVAPFGPRPPVARGLRGSKGEHLSRTVTTASPLHESGAASGARPRRWRWPRLAV